MPPGALIFAMLLATCPGTLSADPGNQGNAVKAAHRCIALEIYTRSREPQIAATAETIRKLVGDLHGVRLKVYDLDEQPQAAERLDKIAKAYRITRTELPFVYGLNRVVSGVADSSTWTSRLRSLLHVEVFTRLGCSRCDGAKRYLPSFRAKYPGLQVEVLDIVNDPQANQRFIQLANQQGIGGISVPGFWLCQRLLIGFDNEIATGGRLDATLERWTFAWELAPIKPKPPGAPAKVSAIPAKFAPFISAILMSGLPDPPPAADKEEAPELPLPIAGNESAPPLEIRTDAHSPQELAIDAPTTSQAEAEDEVEVPVLGRLSVNKLGMPIFTILIGLIDGFNPCALWILLFLLSVLVNLQDRWKILAVAGTFVLVSGIAYFTFMAAWLNIMLLVGFLRWVQILLALLALCVGTIHVKDFFAFKKGISLSIPESAKPGIYQRVHRIVMAENLFAAITGAIVLAVLVNIVELLCTAGLPAMYSHVLMLQKYPEWQNYAYLLLYIAAYMLDDTIMVAIVVITLGKRKLQENHGRWLKLVSGLVILALGLVLLFKPEWLG